MAVNKVVFGAVSIMDISDSTVTADKLAKGVTAYDKTGEKITGTMEASSVPTLQEKTVTPSTSVQSITADNGYDGLSKVIVNGDADLVAGNIKSGISIFGVTGTYAGSGGGGGYNLKIVSFTPSKNQLAKSQTINHNCGKIPKFVMVLSEGNNSSYLCSGCGENTQQSASFILMSGSAKYTVNVTSTTFIFASTENIRYKAHSKYTFYFFY